MKYRVEVNRSQFDAMPVVVLPVSPVEPHADVIPIGTDVHVFTDAELRARDERIIRAALDWWDFDGSYGLVETFDNTTVPEEVAEIIAAAEAVR